MSQTERPYMPHPFRRQIWPASRTHEYGNTFCADCGRAKQARAH